jgi:Lar family restriction alleviation protein
MGNSWTRITDDEATWPPFGERTLLYDARAGRVDISCLATPSSRYMDTFTYWQPLPEPPELKPEPCPFCGGNDIIAFNTVGNSFMYCKNCRAEGPRVSGDGGKASRIRAIEAWNRRTEVGNTPRPPKLIQDGEELTRT